MRYTKGTVTLLVTALLLIGIVANPVWSKETPDYATLNYGFMVDTTYLDTTEENENFILTNSRAYLDWIINRDTLIKFRFKYSFFHRTNPLWDLPEGEKVDIHVYDLDFLFFETAFDDFELKFGRAFYDLGSGIVMNGIADGAEGSYKLNDFTFKLVANYTGLIQEDNNEFNFFIEDPTGTGIALSSGINRLFAGLSISWDLDFIIPYILGLYERDFETSDENPYRYNSIYAGAGVEGQVENLSYGLEVLGEFGNREIIATDTTEASTADVRAWALASLVEYQINPQELALKISAEYLLASGGDPTADVDNNFKAFGLAVTGFVFRPEFYNIEAVRVGVSLNPLFPLVDNFEFIVKGSYYQKEDTAGTLGQLSNITEERDGKRILGTALDFSLNYAIFHDALILLNFGLFFPAESFYSSDLIRTYQITTALYF